MPNHPCLWGHCLNAPLRRSETLGRCAPPPSLASPWWLVTSGSSHASGGGLRDLSPCRARLVSAPTAPVPPLKSHARPCRCVAGDHLCFLTGFVHRASENTEIMSVGRSDVLHSEGGSSFTTPVTLREMRNRTTPVPLQRYKIYLCTTGRVVNILARAPPLALQISRERSSPVPQIPPIWGVI